MLRKILNGLLVVACAVLILLSGFAWGAASARKQPEVSSSAGGFPATPQIGSSTPDMTTFWQAWQIIDQKYLRDASTTDQQKVQGATAGLVASLGDPYTEYFAPSDAQSFEEDVTGDFGGIGAELGAASGTVTVIAPIKDSPAAAAGLKSGDQIIGVGATSTQGLSIDDVSQIIRGPVGSSVKLTILRGSSTTPMTLNIVRQEISAPTLDFTMKGNVAYIQLYQFNANVDTLFTNAIRQAALDNAEGIVLDLRGNPGGYLDTAIDMAGWFLPRGALVVSQANRDGSVQKMYANGNAALAKIPTVILVDGGSASAAEILSGALRDDRKVPLVGQTTFGKGTVQELDTLPDGSLLKVTIAHWVLPSGGILENGGLKPDYAVAISDADVAAGNDPQLSKALQVVQQEISAEK